MGRNRHFIKGDCRTFLNSTCAVERPSSIYGRIVHLEKVAEFPFSLSFEVDKESMFMLAELWVYGRSGKGNYHLRNSFRVRHSKCKRDVFSFSFGVLKPCEGDRLKKVYANIDESVFRT
jgi:hypothetical protein